MIFPRVYLSTRAHPFPKFLKILAIEMSCNLTRSRRPFWYFGSPKRCIGFLDSWPNSAKICSQYWAEWFPDEPMGCFNLVWNTFNTKRWRLYGIYFQLSYRDMKSGSLCCQVACVCFRLLYEYLKKWQKILMCVSTHNHSCFPYIWSHHPWDGDTQVYRTCITNYTRGKYSYLSLCQVHSSGIIVITHHYRWMAQRAIVFFIFYWPTLRDIHLASICLI